MSESDGKDIAPVVPADLGVAKPDIQDELAQIASSAARPYFAFADLIAKDIKDEEVKAAARMNSKEAPMFMHMIKDFMSAQMKSNARAKAEKRSVNIFVGNVNMPARRKIDDAEVIDVEESKANDVE